MSGAGENFGQALVMLLRLVVSLLTPLSVILSCGASYVLTYRLGYPQFTLWAVLADVARHLATVNIWLMAVLAVFVLAALPLAWVAYRERPVQASGAIGEWLGLLAFGGGTWFLAVVFPGPGSITKQVFFAFLLFTVCGGACEALMSTVKLVAQSRPQPGREVVEAQKVHGHAQLASEAEAISLLDPGS